MRANVATSALQGPGRLRVVAQSRGPRIRLHKTLMLEDTERAKRTGRVTQVVIDRTFRREGRGGANLQQLFPPPWFRPRTVRAPNVVVHSSVAVHSTAQFERTIR